MINGVKKGIDTFFIKLRTKRYNLSLGRMIVLMLLAVGVTMALTLHTAVTTPLISKLNIVGENRWATVEDFFSRVINLEDIVSGDQFSEKYYKYLGVDKSYPLRDEIKEAIFVIDSLNREVELWRIYARNVSDILGGRKEVLSDEDSIRSIVTSASSVSVARIALDSILRDKVSLRLETNHQQLETNRMYTPLVGRITHTFNRRENHLGIVISPTMPLSPVMATDQGTIVDIKWDSQSGYTIYILHPQNMMSIYKNVSSVLKRKGEVVKAQEAIGYIGKEQHNGSEGEFSLYYELWINGSPVDPEKRLIF